MSAYKVEVAGSAARDLRSILDFIAQDNPEGAVAWVGEIERNIGELATFPERASFIPEPSGRLRGYRHLMFGKYRIVFRTAGKKVLVVRVIHGAQLLEIDEESK